MTKIARIKPIENITKRPWDEWVAFLEGINAQNLEHKDIAHKVYEELDGTIENPGWWAQSIALAYEQFAGMRVPGQMQNGKFQTSVSRSTKLGMQELMKKWTSFAKSDDAVQEMVTGAVKVSGTEKRITWRAKSPYDSSIVIASEPRPNGYAAIITTEMGLESPALNEAAKARWTVILARFLDTLI